MSLSLGFLLHKVDVTMLPSKGGHENSLVTEMAVSTVPGQWHTCNSHAAFQSPLHIIASLYPHSTYEVGRMVVYFPLIDEETGTNQ